MLAGRTSAEVDGSESGGKTGTDSTPVELDKSTSGLLFAAGAVETVGDDGKGCTMELLATLDRIGSLVEDI